MKLSDDQIRSIMEKNVSTKTILVDNELLDKTISEHESQGWKLINKVSINDKAKITFQKNN